MAKKRPTPRKRWEPLTQRTGSMDTERYAALGISVPDEVWANSVYSVFVRYIGQGALHLSFHRHDREAVRDWRHFQAIKNEIAGPERTAIEVFPPESQLVDAANEYHLWVLPEGYPLPFVMDVRNVMTEADGRAVLGPSKARQRPWQAGIPTGLGVES